MLVAIWSVLALLIYRLGWDVMEPWTYLVGFGVVLVGYGYLAATQRELSPIAMYQRAIEWKRKKNYHDNGFDLERYEEVRIS